MFGKYAFQVKMVKTDKAVETAAEIPRVMNLDPEMIKELMTHTVMLGGAAYTGVKVLDTLSKIAVIAAKAKF